jgi:hypothetical protein
MCRLCEGFDLGDMLAMEAAAIEEYGWIVTGVGPPDDGPLGDHGGRWAYTVGLLDGAGHPELVIAGPEIRVGGRLLNELGRMVCDGTRLAAGDSVVTSEGTVRIGPVDPAQARRGAFNLWFALHEHGALATDRFEILQVFAPESWFCECHHDSQPNLADGTVRIDVPAPRLNRAARRARRNRH